MQEGGFGNSVSTAGDVNGDGFSDVIVGQRLADAPGEEAGAAYVYHGSPTGLSNSPDWSAAGEQAVDHFGDVVSTAGDVNGDGFADVIIGVPDRDSGPTAGSAYVYHGSASGLSATPDWVQNGGTGNEQFGFSVSAGDFDGDGLSDVVVGVPGYDGEGLDMGGVFVYFGTSSGVSSSPLIIEVNESQINLFFGRSVSTVGDLDGDGYADLAIGAPGYIDFPNGPGAIYIYEGYSGGLIDEWSERIGGFQLDSGFGAEVKLAGDVDGDGYSDMIVGMEGYDPTSLLPEAGRFRVYYGDSNILDGFASDQLIGDQAEAALGNSVFTAGDVNGDGYSDVIVGEAGFDGTTGPDSGRARVFHGSPRGLATTADWEASSGSGAFAYSISTAGDVNGDGYADVIVGAPFYDSGQTDEGKAWLYLGSPFGISPGASGAVESNETSANFGHAVACAGDVNGDGFSDVVIGAPSSSFNSSFSGAAYLYYGSLTGLTPAPTWSAGGLSSSSQFGFSVGGAGDVNGDGFADVIVGSPRYATGFRGAAFLYYGRLPDCPRFPIGSPPRRRTPRSSAIPWGLPGTSTRTATRTSSLAPSSGTTRRSTRGRRSSSTARRTVRRWTRTGRWRVTSSRPSSASPSARRATSTATGTRTSWSVAATAARSRVRRSSTTDRRTDSPRLRPGPTSGLPAPPSAARSGRQATSTATVSPT
jgi:hypothetical protein